MKKWFNKNLIADVMLVSSFFIIFCTTYTLNKYISFYLLSVAMLGGSYLIMKGGK
ncbi:MAG: hypothetical protein ACRC68_04320 [Clostridium sp.]